MGSIQQVKPSELMKIDHFVKRMVNEWITQGATTQQVNEELDNRILKCGQEQLKLYIKQVQELKIPFSLFKSGYYSLIYSYGILSRYEHLPKVLTRELCDELEAEWRKWNIKFEGATKLKLCFCVLALNKFAEIQESGKPFIVNQ